MSEAAELDYRASMPATGVFYYHFSPQRMTLRGETKDCLPPPLILVVEDKKDDREILKLLLETRNLRVHEAGSGEEAVERARMEFPDLILMDLSLPMRAGFEATLRIRAQEESRHTPVLGMTARHWDFDWRESALRAGCTECIRKPSTFAEVNYICKRYLTSEPLTKPQRWLNI